MKYSMEIVAKLKVEIKSNNGEMYNIYAIDESSMCELFKKHYNSLKNSFFENNRTIYFSQFTDKKGVVETTISTNICDLLSKFREIKKINPGVYVGSEYDFDGSDLKCILQLTNVSELKTRLYLDEENEDTALYYDKNGFDVYQEPNGALVYNTQTIKILNDNFSKEFILIKVSPNNYIEEYIVTNEYGIDKGVMCFFGKDNFEETMVSTMDEVERAVDLIAKENYYTNFRTYTEIELAKALSR